MQDEIILTGRLMNYNYSGSGITYGGDTQLYIDEDGTYYFKARFVSSDGSIDETITSTDFEYVKPTNKVPAVNNLHLEDRNGAKWLVWDPVENSYYYIVHIIKDGKIIGSVRKEKNDAATNVDRYLNDSENIAFEIFTLSKNILEEHYSEPVVLNLRAEAEAEKPTTSVKDTDVEEGTIVTLNCNTFGADIYYTVDGTDPVVDASGTMSGTTKLYSDAIVINKDMTIKAIAVAKGYKNSGVATFTYKVIKNWGDISAADQKALFAGDASKVPEGIWYLIDGKVYTENGATDIEKIYNANKITFNDEIRVYHSTRRLWENRDYTIDYKNNTNVASKDAGAKAPLFNIKGKGSYTKAAQFTFSIVPADINQANLITETVAALQPGKALDSVKPALTYAGKKLKANTDYTLKFTPAGESAELNAKTKTEPGKNYEIEITGKGSFSGKYATKVLIKVYDPKDKSIVPMNKVKVNVPKGGVYYSAEGHKLTDLFDNTKPDAKITVFNAKEQLTYGTDFYVDDVVLYDAGKYTVAVHGKGDKYIGDKIVTVEIGGIAANKVKVEGLPAKVEYTGKAYTLPAGVKLTSAKGVLTEGKNYTVEVHDGGSTGKVNVVFELMGEYSGVIKKTITVGARSLAGATVTVSDAEYSKAGAIPESVEVKLADGTVLREGIDYTLSYKNNAKAADKNSGKSAPTVTVKGIGNYTGSKTQTFTVKKADITKCVTLVAVDKDYNVKAGAYKSVPKLMDGGKAVAIGKDIDKINTKTAFTYYNAATGEQLSDKAVVAAGTTIEVRVTVNCGANSPYKAGQYELKGYYKVLNKGYNISKAKVSIKDISKLVFNNGKEIIPLKESDLKVSIGKTDLKSSDYEIVSVKNNRFLGTASIEIRGKGAYGGTKTFTFKIGARALK